MQRNTILAIRAGGCALCAALFLAAADCVADPAPAPLRVQVVSIVAQADFLTWLLESTSVADLPPLAISVTHVDDLATRLRTAHYDLVIAHDHARPLRRLQRDGTLVEGRGVFANPVAIIGPRADPAGIAQATSLADAIARLRENKVCWVVNRQGGKRALQDPLLGGESPLDCIMEPSGSGGAHAVVTAAGLGAYTVWGYHPFMRLRMPAMRAFVIGDPALLRQLRAWVVADSPRRDAAAAVVRLLASDAVQQRLAQFRIDGDDANQAWWPAAAAGSAQSGARRHD